MQKLLTVQKQTKKEKYFINHQNQKGKKGIFFEKPIDTASVEC